MKRKWIIRVKKVKDFTVMSNHHLRDNKLSAKAMWIMSHLLSKPDDWVIRIEELIKNFKDWRDGIFTWVSELVKKWYMKKTQKRSNWKFDEVERLLYEIPPTTEKPFTEKPLTEKPLTENPLTEIRLRKIRLRKIRPY